MTSMVRNVTTVAFPHLTKRAMLRKAVIRRRNLERLKSTRACVKTPRIFANNRAERNFSRFFRFQAV
jgi:hypothetical protein